MEVSLVRLFSVKVKEDDKEVVKDCFDYLSHGELVEEGDGRFAIVNDNGNALVSGATPQLIQTMRDCKLLINRSEY